MLGRARVTRRRTRTVLPSLTRLMLRGSVTAVLGRIVSAGSNLAIAAEMLRHLGSFEYGQLAVAFSFLSLIPFSDLGIGSAVVSTVAADHAAGRQDEVRREVSNAYAVLKRVAVLFLLAGLVIAILGIDSHARETNLPAVAALLIAVGAVLPTGIYIRVLQGIQRSDVTNALSALAALVALVVGLISLDVGAPLWVIALAWYLQLAIVPVASAIFIRRNQPALSASMTPVRADMLALIRRGIPYVVVALLAAGSFETDEVILGAIKGPRSVAVYDVHSRLFSFAYTTIIVALAPLWPAVAAAVSRSDAVWLRRTVNRAFAAALGAALIGAGAGLLLLPIFVRDLSGGQIRLNDQLGVCFAGWLVLVTLGTAVSTVLNGLQIIKPQMVLAGLGLLVNLAVAIWLTPILGASGPVIGTIATQVVFGGVALVLVNRAINRVPAAELAA